MNPQSIVELISLGKLANQKIEEYHGDGMPVAFEGDAFVQHALSFLLAYELANSKEYKEMER